MECNIALLVLLLILTVPHLICQRLTILEERIAKIDRFEGQCKGQENLAMTFHNLTFTYKGRMMSINGKLLVKHDLNNQIQQDLTLIRCRNRDSLDSCEMYNYMKFRRCCDLLNSDGQIWSTFVESIHPRIRCPVKAGIYSLDNATFDANIPPLIPIDGWYWKVGLKSHDTKTKEQLLCMQVEGEILLIRKNKARSK